MRSRGVDVPRLDVSTTIEAHPSYVVRAFFEPAALRVWLKAANAVTTPRTLGAYAIEWAPSDTKDEIFGRLGGVFRGTVMHFDWDRGFFVADAYWLPPEGDPIGPTALAVTCREDRLAAPSVRRPGDISTDLHVQQTGFEESVRWRHYYDIASAGLARALVTLKALLEQ
jgi:hypothetical protein